jgi:YHS domain-containing protein
MTENQTTDASQCSTTSTDAHAPASAGTHTGSNLLGPADDDLATCPVMAGRPVVKSEAEAQGLFRDYKGKRYWLCCAGCGPAFDADPEKYATAG